MRAEKRILTEEEIKIVEELASRGVARSQIADYLGMSDKTFHTKKQEDERVSTAYKKGRARGAEFVTGKLFERINSGDTTAIIFYLKTQCGWKEARDDIASIVAEYGGSCVININSSDAKILRQ